MSNSSKNITDIKISKPPKGAWLRQEEDVLVLGARVRTLWGFAVLVFAILTVFIFFLAIVTLGIVLDSSWVFFPILLIVEAVIWNFALTHTWGKIEIKIDEKNCEIFKGVWKWGEREVYALNQMKIVQTDMYLDGKEVEFLEYNSQRIFPNGWMRLKPLHYNYLFESICKVLIDKFQDEKLPPKGFYDDMSEHLLEP